MQNTIHTSFAVPAQVSRWADKYFHHSAFDVPVKYPNKKIVAFLSRFQKNKPIELYRGINKYNEGNRLITSWSYSKEVAKGYIKDGGKVQKKKFAPENVLLDTTVLNVEQKRLLGYDYQVDDKEVLIII